MGLDRTEHIRKPCPCGQGQLEVDWCTPDHPYADPTSGNFQLAIRCARCSQEYVFTDQGTHAVLLQKTEVDARDREESQINKREKQLAERNQVQEYLAQFVERLQWVPTAVGKRQLLKATGFYVQSIGTFRKDLAQRGIGDMVRGQFSISHVPRMLLVLARQDKELVEEIKQMEQRKEELNRPLTPVGEPIGELTREAVYSE
ncbi:MAG: hypothetical protein QOH71_101 [Blastocatellia bacterium]|nr:hypothetical protein [Blastocatellia bacterium]